MFESRFKAGKLLAQELKNKGYGGIETIVLGIPRGGIVTAHAVSNALNCPLDIVITRKIPAPHQPELALGAVGPGGVRVLDVGLIERTGTKEAYLKEKIDQLQREIQDRNEKFRGDKLPLQIQGKTIIVVDDGIATGATVEAAVRYIKTENPRKIVLAVPVASRDSVEKLRQLVQDMAVLEMPGDFMAVGQFYRNFEQVSDEKVIKILNSKNQI